MSGFFQRMIVSLADEWLKGHFGSAFLEANGLILDLAMQRLVESVRAGQPLACYPDALPRIAAQRRLRLYETEPLASKRFRLSRWLQLHHERGTHVGEMRHLQPYFLGADGKGTLPTIHIVHAVGDGSVNSTWHTLSGGAYGDPTRGTYSVHRQTPSNFDFDSNGANSAASVPWDPNVQAAWSRFYVFIEAGPTDVQAMANYDDPDTDYDDPNLFYDGLSSAVAADIVAMVRDWKASHSALWTVALSTRPIDPTATPTQDADGWWNLPTNGVWGRTIDPATHLPTRPPYLTFLLDRSQP